MKWFNAAQAFTAVFHSCCSNMPVFDKPWILGILGNRELRQDQQAPADKKNQNRNLQVRLHVSSHSWCYQKKISWMNLDAKCATYRWTSRTGQAIISTGTLKDETGGTVRCAQQNEETMKSSEFLTKKVQQNRNIFHTLSELRPIGSFHSLQLQQLQDVPSHQADHVGPITENTVSLVSFNRYDTHNYLPHSVS